MLYLNILLSTFALSFLQHLQCFHRVHPLQLTQEPNPQNANSFCFTLSLPTLSANPPAWSMRQLFSCVFSVKHISRQLWYSQRVKIKAESLSTSCSAAAHFPWQQIKGGVQILVFSLISFTSIGQSAWIAFFFVCPTYTSCITKMVVASKTVCSCQWENHIKDNNNHKCQRRRQQILDVNPSYVSCCI